MRGLLLASFLLLATITVFNGYVAYAAWNKGVSAPATESEDAEARTVLLKAVLKYHTKAPAVR